MKLLKSDRRIFPDSRLSPCRIHVQGFGTWDTRIRGHARRGDCLHVIWTLGDARLATLRVRVVIHILSTRSARLWCRPATPDDRAVLVDLSASHDLSVIVSQLWIVPREIT